MLFDVGQAVLKLFVRGGGGRIGDFSLSSAMAAVNRAIVGCVEEHAVRVTMRDAGHGHVTLFSERVFHVRLEDREFLFFGYGLKAYRAIRVVLVHQGGVIRSDPHVELFMSLRESLALVRCDVKDVFELIHRLDPLLLLPDPAVPVFFGNIFPYFGSRSGFETFANFIDGHNIESHSASPGNRIQSVREGCQIPI